MKHSTAALLALTMISLAGSPGPRAAEEEGRNPMSLPETERIIIRRFAEQDWRDVHDLAVDWRRAPGPEFDKWPTSEEAAKGMAAHFAGNERFLALCLRDGGKVIGLLGLNGLDGEGRFDLGHVILSEYQDDDVDREALNAIVGYIFRDRNARIIVTNNASNHVEQLAPLKSLGFKVADPNQPGTLTLTKTEWQRRQRER